MATTIFNFPSDRRSGRTTLAVGMWQEMRVHGFECAYVVPTIRMAREMSIRFGMPQGELMGVREFELRFIVLDYLDLLEWPLDLAKARLPRLELIP
ncbi:MAG: hypothetical protein GY701_12515 [Sulfitobacter sp.]|nr:hypothetical protein [Sulfitobacter sp.]